MSKQTKVFKKLDRALFEVELSNERYVLKYKDVTVGIYHMMFERAFAPRRKMRLTYSSAEQRIDSIMVGKGSEVELSIIERL